MYTTRLITKIHSCLRIFELLTHLILTTAIILAVLPTCLRRPSSSLLLTSLTSTSHLVMSRSSTTFQPAPAPPRPLLLQQIPASSLKKAHEVGVFHAGQVAFQNLVGTRRVARGYEEWLSASIHQQDQVAQLERAPIAYVAFQDPKTTLNWLTPIVPSVDALQAVLDQPQPLIQVLASNRIRVNAFPHESWKDPFAEVLQSQRANHLASNGTQPGPFVSLHIMQEFTRDRMRIQGRLSKVTTREAEGYDSFEIELDLCISLCPKYILDRRLVDLRDECLNTLGVAQLTTSSDAGSSSSSSPSTSNSLPLIARSLIEEADTFWLATGAKSSNWGSSASHRGGKAGFVRIRPNELDEITGASYPVIEWGDYPGNQMFVSLGNVFTHPKAGITFLDFSDRHHGSILQLAGTLQIIHSKQPQGELDHANRRLRLVIEEWRLIQNALPFKWKTMEESSFNPPLYEVARNSVKGEAFPQPTRAASAPNSVELSLIEVIHPQNQSYLPASTATTPSSSKEDGVLTFRFTPTRPDSSFDGFHFLAGQYGTFDLVINNHVETRCWTITSQPNQQTRAPAWLDRKQDEMIPVLEISVKRHPHGLASQFLHGFPTVDGHPNLRLTLRGIEGQFILPSAYWNNNTDTNKFAPSLRLLTWIQGRRAIQQAPQKESQKQLRSSLTSSTDNLPPLSLVFWGGGIGVTPLIALQRFLTSSLDSSSINAPSRYTWIYSVPRVEDVCFADDLQRLQRLAQTSGKLHLSIIVYFSRMNPQSAEDTKLVQLFEDSWCRSIGQCNDNLKAIFQVRMGRPELKSVSEFLNGAKLAADTRDSKSDLPSNSSFKSLNYVCGPTSFMQWSKETVQQIHETQPNLIGERVRMEEFTY